MKKIVTFSMEIETWAKLKEHALNMSGTVEELINEWVAKVEPVKLNQAQKLELTQIREAETAAELAKMKVAKEKADKEAEENADGFPVREGKSFAALQLAEIMKSRPKKKLFTDEELEQIKHNREERDRV